LDAGNTYIVAGIAHHLRFLSIRRALFKPRLHTDCNRQKARQNRRRGKGMVGSIMYGMICTRSDVVYAIQQFRPSHRTHPRRLSESPITLSTRLHLKWNHLSIWPEQSHRRISPRFQRYNDCSPTSRNWFYAQLAVNGACKKIGKMFVECNQAR